MLMLFEYYQAQSTDRIGDAMTMRYMYLLFTYLLYLHFCIHGLTFTSFCRL